MHGSALQLDDLDDAESEVDCEWLQSQAHGANAFGFVTHAFRQR
jgi:hypothetical protein